METNIRKVCSFKSPRPNPFSDQGDGCQFSFEEEKIITVHGHHYCPLHLPMHLGKANWPDEKKYEIGQLVRQACLSARDHEYDLLDLSGVIFPTDFNTNQFFCPPKAAILFSSCQFHGGAYLSGLNPEKQIYFSNCLFSKHLELSQCRNIVMLGGCTFKTDCTFENTHFSLANFKGSVFSSHMRFDRAVFHGPAEFIKATFEDTVTFKGAEFKGGLWFSHGENKGIANRNIQSANDFSDCLFSAVADFSDRAFLSSTDFSAATFLCAPRFHNSSLHQDTSFHSAKFTDVSSKDCSRAYRTLKQEMEKIRAWDAAGLFFSLEQKSKILETNKPFFDKILSKCYEAISNYGNSAVRPIYAFFTFNLSILCIYTLTALSSLPAISLKSTEHLLAGVFRFWLAQIFIPFSALKPAPEAYDLIWGKYSLLIECIAAVQSIVSLAVIALFLLALRRRFKLD